LEALHVGTQGFSPRTRTERDLIRFGQTEAALALALVRDGVPHEVRMKLAAGAAKTAYFDRVTGRLQPAQASLAQDYAAVLAQRNAALRRVQLELSTRDAIEPWTVRVAELGSRLVSARRDTLAQLEPRFAERAGELGLAGGTLAYDGEPPTVDELVSRLDLDVRRGATGAGPHLDDVRLAAAGRDLRSFGSQGEQRLALLALLLAEAELVPTSPLLLLD